MVISPIKLKTQPVRYYLNCNLLWCLYCVIKNSLFTFLVVEHDIPVTE